MLDPLTQRRYLVPFKASRLPQQFTDVLIIGGGVAGLRAAIAASASAEVLLLTKRPTKVAEILQYADARPRTVATLSEPSFIAAKKLSLEIFQREVRR